MDDKAIGRRIKEERERKKLSQTKLAELAGLAHRQSIGKIEDGERKLQASELFGIAKALGMRADSLLLSIADNQPQAHYLWRHADPEVKGQWEVKFSDYINNYKYVESALSIEESQCIDLPRCTINIEQATPESIYSLAEHIRGQFDLGMFPGVALEVTLEEKYGVRIFYVDLHDHGSAATTRTGTPTIFLNRYEAPHRRIFSLAHELFHLITWSEEIATRSEIEPAFHEKNERLAEVFAAGLLMPSEVFKSELQKATSDGTLSYSDIIALSRTFNVSAPAVLYRMANLRFIPFEMAQKIISDSDFKEIDRAKRERSPTPALLSEKFIKMAYQAYQSSRLSKARLAEMLEVPLVDVESILAERGLIEIDDNEIPLSIA